MASWRVARSLERLREQVNALAPNRGKASDGTLGDLRHQATKSEHNPNAAGVVTAMDITHDPAGGCDCQVLADSLVASRDERIGYIIWNKRIISSTVSPGVWRKYEGSNPHTKHLHITATQAAAVYDDARDWNIRVSDGTAYPHTPSVYPTLRVGVDARSFVMRAQDLLNRAGAAPQLKVDGVFGEGTKAAVVAFQSRKGLVADGVVGPYTWDALLAFLTAPPPLNDPPFGYPPDYEPPLPPDLSERRGCMSILANLFSALRSK